MALLRHEMSFDKATRPHQEFALPKMVEPWNELDNSHFEKSTQFYKKEARRRVAGLGGLAGVAAAAEPRAAPVAEAAAQEHGVPRGRSAGAEAVGQARAQQRAAPDPAAHGRQPAAVGDPDARAQPGEAEAAVALV